MVQRSKRCAVNNCNTGSDEYRRERKFKNLPELSVFRVPKCTIRLQKWMDALQQPLSKTSRVCELHFSEDNILKCDSFVIDGNVTTLFRFRVTLRSDAVPIPIVPNKMECVQSTTEEVEDIGSPYQLSEGSDHLTSKPECISDEDVQYTVSPTSARFLHKDSDNIENENVNTFEIEETESVEICRFCLKEITDGKNIFENYIDGDVPIYLAIRVCLYPIKISFLDILSKYTCDECLNTLSSFVKFRALVMRNDKIQRNHLGKSAPLVPKEALSQKRSLLIENEPHVLKKIKTEPRPAQMCSIGSSIQSKLTNQDVQKKDYSKVRTNSFGSSNQLKLTNQDRQNRNTSNENAETCQQVTKCIKTQLDNNETSPSRPILCSMAPVEVLQKKTDKNQDGGTKPKIMILEENGKQSDSKVETSSCAQSPHDNIPFCMANGYLMEHKLLKGNLRYLKCASAKCPAVSTQKVLMPGVFESKVSIIKNHNHEKPTEIDIRKQKFISVIRRRLQTAKGTSIKSIYDEVCKLDPDSAKLVPMKELTKEICNL